MSFRNVGHTNSLAHGANGGKAVAINRHGNKLTLVLTEGVESNICLRGNKIISCNHLLIVLSLETINQCIYALVISLCLLQQSHSHFFSFLHPGSATKDIRLLRHASCAPSASFFFLSIISTDCGRINVLSRGRQHASAANQVVNSCVYVPC